LQKVRSLNVITPMKYILIGILSLWISSLNAQNPYNCTNAHYEGGINAFRAEVYVNIIYPKIAKLKGTQGEVVIRFIINTEGDIEDIKILKDIGDGCGQAAAEAVRRVKKRWSPARNQKGETVKVMKTLPIIFKLEIETNKTDE